MYVHLYLALNEFTLDFFHAPLRLRKLKYKISKSNYKSTFVASPLIFSTFNTDYGLNLSCKFHSNWKINAEVIQLTMLRPKSTDIFVVAPSMEIFWNWNNL